MTDYLWYNASMQTYTFEQTNSQCVVTWGHFSLNAIIVFFFFVVLMGTAGFLFYLTFFEQKYVVLILLIPNTVLCLGLSVLIAHMLFGKTRFVFNKNGIESVYTCFRFKREKCIPIAEICRFEHYLRLSTRSSTEYLRVICRHKKVDFRPPREVGWLCSRFNIVLWSLKAGETEVPAKLEVPAPIVIEIDSPPQYLEPPLKTRWRYQTEYKGISLQKRGEDRIGSAIGTLFTAIFWNGIVSFFALRFFGVIEAGWQPEGEEWWIAFALLSVFALFGLLIAGFAINVLLDLFRITTWQLASGEAEFRTVRLFTRTARHSLTGWNSLAVCLPKDTEVKPELVAEGNHDAIRKFYDACDSWQVAFINATGERLMAIENLSKPEALWMADVILREQKAIR